MSPYLNAEVNKLIAKHPAREVVGASDRTGQDAVRLLVLCDLIDEAAEKVWRKRGTMLSESAILERLLVLNAELTSCMVRYGETATKLASIGSSWQASRLFEAEQEKAKKRKR